MTSPGEASWGIRECNFPSLGSQGLSCLRKPAKEEEVQYPGHGFPGPVLPGGGQPSNRGHSFLVLQALGRIGVKEGAQFL